MTRHRGQPRRLVVDRRRGAWLGVCRGLADYSGTPVGFVRLAALILVLAGLGLPGVLAYVAVAWLARSTEDRPA